MTEDEWGPWIEHDGKGCPCVGSYVTTVLASGEVAEHIAHGYIVGDSPLEVDCWRWDECFAIGYPNWRIIRYRVRKPRAMAQIRALLENLPERVDA